MYENYLLHADEPESLLRLLLSVDQHTFDEEEIAAFLRPTGYTGGLIDFPQLLQYASSRKATALAGQLPEEEQITRDVFAVLGGRPDSSGTIRVATLQEVLERFQLELDAKVFVESVDDDGDGNVSYEEFKGLCNDLQRSGSGLTAQDSNYFLHKHLFSAAEEVEKSPSGVMKAAAKKGKPGPVTCRHLQSPQEVMSKLQEVCSAHSMRIQFAKLSQKGKQLSVEPDNDNIQSTSASYRSVAETRDEMSLDPSCHRSAKSSLCPSPVSYVGHPMVASTPRGIHDIQERSNSGPVPSTAVVSAPPPDPRLEHLRAQSLRCEDAIRRMTLRAEEMIISLRNENDLQKESARIARGAALSEGERKFIEKINGLRREWMTLKKENADVRRVSPTPQSLPRNPRAPADSARKAHHRKRHDRNVDPLAYLCRWYGSWEDSPAPLQTVHGAMHNKPMTQMDYWVRH
jgi:Ca2+-binding EF-hand superfamily protein